jgi:hypothetical protein
MDSPVGRKVVVHTAKWEFEGFIARFERHGLMIEITLVDVSRNKFNTMGKEFLEGKLSFKLELNEDEDYTKAFVPAKTGCRFWSRRRRE